MLKKKDR